MDETRRLAPVPGDGSARYTDNVVRMHLFMKAHPEIAITLPAEPGGDFTATRDGELIMSDRSLGWLMDHLEKEFPAEPGTVTP